MAHFFEHSWDKLLDTFRHFDGYNAVEIVLLSCVVYAVLSFLKRRSSMRLAKYIALFLLVGIIFGTELAREHFIILPSLFTYFVLFVVAAILVLFPYELRQSLWRLSSPKEAAVIYSGQECSEQDLRKTVAELVRSIQNMSKKNTGALIVIVPDWISEQIVESGTIINAKVTGYLIESLFITKGPLHDGAVIIKGDRLISAGCFLPLTQSQKISKELGTRHRAGIGVTENSNSISIICSEETGIISVARNGVLKSYYDGVMLQDVLEQVFGLKANRGK